jgi:hypothetical protein
MMNPNISPQDRAIILQICDFQIESYTRLRENESGLDIELTSIGLDINPAIIREEASKEILFYGLLKENPKEVFNQGPHILSRIKETLLNYQDEIDADERDIKNFWNKLFLATFIFDHLN